MTAQDELDVICTENGWVDLKIGEKAVLRGRIDPYKVGTNVIVICFPDWSSVAVDVVGGMNKTITPYTHVSMIIERTEDGMQTTPDTVKACI